MLDIYNNKTSFLKIKPHNLINILLLFILIIIFTLIFIVFTEIYSNYQTKGYITCTDKCLLNTYIPSDITYEKIYFNNKSYSYKILSEEIYLDEQTLTSLRKLSIIVDHEFLNEEIVNLNFYYNKQRIIQKIKEKMF